MKAKAINSSKGELKKREKIGWYALAATALLGVVLVATEAPEFLKVLLFIPSFVAGLAFLQWCFSFTIPMHLKELYDLVKYEKEQKLTAARKKYQGQARLLVLCSAIIGLLITASAFST